MTHGSLCRYVNPFDAPDGKRRVPARSVTARVRAEAVRPSGVRACARLALRTASRSQLIKTQQEEQG